MARCTRCGNGGLFRRMNIYGLCDDCELARVREEAADRERREREEARRREEEAAPFRPEFNYGTGELLAYSYDDVGIFVPDDCKAAADRARRKTELELKLEPTNTHDPGAVAVYARHGKIGYLYRGKLQDMARDFLKKHDTVLAAMGERTADEQRIGLYFYLARHEFIARVKKKYTCHEFTLTGNTNAEMQDAVGGVSEGDPVKFWYDEDKGKCEVSAGGWGIGYLPTSANKIDFNNYPIPFGFVTETIERDSGKCTAKVMAIEKFEPGMI
jgi:hypothetical protein